MKVGRWVSFWDCHIFRGELLNFRGVHVEDGVYITGTPMTSIFEGQTPQEKAETPTKTMVVLGSRYT